MRCPKCGYISFDRLKSCDKCRADLTSVAAQLQGTAARIAPPYFLAAALKKQQSAGGDSGPALYVKDEPQVLSGPKAAAPPADQSELDLSNVALDELDLSEVAQEELDLSEAAQEEINPDEQPMPSLDFKDIDLSDLAMPQKKEEELVFSLGSEPEVALLSAEPARDEEEESTREMESSSPESDDLLIFDEQPPASRMNEAEAGYPPADAEDEDIIDLSSLMGFEESPATPPEQEEDSEIFDLFSLGDEPEELHLSLEDTENRPAEDTKTPTAMADIPDLGLTLENDDRK